jgi:hypothetical protein
MTLGNGFSRVSYEEARKWARSRPPCRGWLCAPDLPPLPVSRVKHQKTPGNPILVATLTSGSLVLGELSLRVSVQSMDRQLQPLNLTSAFIREAYKIEQHPYSASPEYSLIQGDRYSKEYGDPSRSYCTWYQGTADNPASCHCRAAEK